MISRRALLRSIAGAAIATPAIRVSDLLAKPIPVTESGFNETAVEFSIEPIKTRAVPRWFKTEINLHEIDLEKWVRNDPVIQAYRQMKDSES
jgi:hypothetical protein